MKTRPKKIVVVFMIALVLLLFVVGCKKAPAGNKEGELLPPQNEGEEGNAQDTQGETPDFVYIKNPERVEHRTYSIVKPGEWSETEYNNSFIYLPPEGNLSDPFSEKFALIVAFLPEEEKRSLKELTELDIEKTGELLAHLKVIEQKDDASLGEIDAIRVVFTAEYEGRTLQSTQVRAMQGNRFYVLSQQCEYGKCRYSDLLDEMATTFEWKNP